MSNAATTRKTWITCPKCDGAGHIEAFGNVANGRCFECGGAKKILVDRWSPSKALRNKVNCIGYDIDDLLEFAPERPDLVPARVERIARELFAVGTDNARELLAYLAAGIRCDEVGARHQTDRVLARQLAAAVVAKGHEMKAAA